MTDGAWLPRHTGRPRLVWPVPIDPSGTTGPTRGQAVGPSWRRCSKNLYLPAGVDATRPEQRAVEAFARCPQGAVTGWASLWLQGAAFFDGAHIVAGRPVRLPVLLVESGARLRSTADVRITRVRLDDHEVVVRFGIRCTIPERALLDHVTQVGDLRESVVAIDMAAAAQLTSIRRIRTYLGRRPRAHSVRLLQRALDLADEHAASPQESRFRLLWHLDAGWGRPLVNRDVLDLEGRFIGRPDLLDPVRGIVGEFAGAVHRSLSRHRRDVLREDLFRRAGLEYVEVVGADLHDAPLVVGRMEAAEARAGRLPRRWRLGPAHVALDDVLDHHDVMVALARAPTIAEPRL